MITKDDSAFLKRYLYKCNQELMAGNKEKAKHWFDKAFNIDPNDSNVMWLHNNFYEPSSPIGYSDYVYYLEGHILERQESEYD